VSGPFEPGERALLIDGRGRRYLLRLQSGGVFHMHTGTLQHDLIIGSPEGTRVESAGGMALVCFRPTLVDFVLKMPRGAQVVYPKDLGAIVIHADVFPGARVLEAGTGSGALTIALCRATGSEGRVVSYDLRPEFQAKGAANIESFFGKTPAWLELREGDVREVSTSGETFERVILDMPEPWTMLEAIDTVVTSGGIVCGFLPTTGQVQSFVLTLAAGCYEQVETFETMLRPWHVTERSVRPDHRMVAHTGFITVARKASPRVIGSNHRD
jgi:tRNA (adenine57-N1/adenine58-N1)-methyltransferase catalytic subunit